MPSSFYHYHWHYNLTSINAIIILPWTLPLNFHHYSCHWHYNFTITIALVIVMILPLPLTLKKINFRIIIFCIFVLKGTHLAYLALLYLCKVQKKSYEPKTKNTMFLWKIHFMRNLTFNWRKDNFLADIMSLLLFSSFVKFQ